MLVAGIRGHVIVFHLGTRRGDSRKRHELGNVLQPQRGASFPNDGLTYLKPIPGQMMDTPPGKTGHQDNNNDLKYSSANPNCELHVISS